MKLIPLILLLSLIGCAQEGGLSVTINCTSSTTRDCGSVALSSTPSGSQTVTPTTTLTIPLSGTPKIGITGNSDLVPMPSITINH